MLDAIGLAGLAGIGVVWIAYPAAIWVLAMLRRRAAFGHGHAFTSVSVLIATRETAAVVRQRVLDCHQGHCDASLEVVVSVDAPSLDPAYDVLRTLPGTVVVLADPPGGKAAALNAAGRAARGDVLVFTDTYQRFGATTIHRLLSTLEDPAIGAVSGRLVLPTTRLSVASLYWRYEAWLRNTEALVHSTVGVTGAVWAMRRELWTPVPHGLLLDDLYSPMSLIMRGYRVLFRGDALAYDHRAPTVSGEYRRKVRTLTGVIQLCVWMPELLLPWRNPLYVQFMFHKLLRLLTPYFAFAVLLYLLWNLYPIFASRPLAIGVGTAALATWLATTRSRMGSSIRRMAAEAVLLQVAMVAAAYHGIRADWDVWR